MYEHEPISCPKDGKGASKYSWFSYPTCWQTACTCTCTVALTCYIWW